MFYRVSLVVRCPWSKLGLSALLKDTSTDYSSCQLSYLNQQPFGYWPNALTTKLSDPLSSHHPFFLIALCVCVLLLGRFNMPHDDNPKCREAGIKHQYHVMAPTLNYDTSPWSWSKCSRKYITEFLE